MNQPRHRRSAIVISGWGWSTYNALERVALALGRAGWRVLYCDNPVSYLRKLGGIRSPLAENVEGFQPEFLGHRLNSLPVLRRWQAGLLAAQLLRQAASMDMETPMAIYGHGYWLPDTARALKARGALTVYICLDRLENGEEEALAELSDRVLAIPPSVYHKLKARFGDKVSWLPQIGPDLGPHQRNAKRSRAIEQAMQVPSPRLGYLGPPSFRVHAGLLKELLTAHPEWHFVACGPVPGLKLPNLHDVGWIAPDELPALASLFDVGLMPYDCGNEMNLHCVPLKLFDYFAVGLPVVSTPAIHLWGCRDLVYLGSTPTELADGIRQALAEAPDDPRRGRRREIARAHSLEETTRILPSILLGDPVDYPGSAFKRECPPHLSPPDLAPARRWTEEDRAQSGNKPTGRLDAIVLSGWDWKTNNVPERVAAALARAGWRILYCENPASFIRRRKQGRIPLSEGVEGFRPRLLGHRLNALRSASKWQARLLVEQILRQAREMGMTRPIVIYPHGPWVVDLARELKRRGITGVFVCMDHIDREESEALADSSALTLAIPRTTLSRLEARFGAKVRLLPQLGPDLDGAGTIPASSRALAAVQRIPHPRLAYLGPPADRLHVSLLKALFTAHPDWHFLACGTVPNLRLPNLHDTSWVNAKELPAISAAVDVGFMPYDCGREQNLHCVPLKLFDYFAAGLPVVSTPLIHLREFGNLVYLGDTAEELAAGVRQALAEPPNDPRREERRRIAREHSLAALSKILPTILFQALEQTSDGDPRNGHDSRTVSSAAPVAPSTGRQR